MRVYAESSAVLSMLLFEPSAPLVRRVFTEATFVATSALTLLEIRRAIVRGETIGAIPEGRGGDMRSDLNRMSANWSLIEMEGEILERAGRPFPAEPIRALDAIHVASAMAIRETVGPVAVLSLDDRIRRCARELGFEVVPALGDMIHEGP